MATSQWLQQYQQYQQQPQHYQQPQQYAQAQQYQQPQQYQQYQQNQHYQAQQYQQSQQAQPTQQYQVAPNSQPTQQFQQQPQGHPVQQYQQNQQYQAQHYQQAQQGQLRQQYQHSQQGPTAQQYQHSQQGPTAQQYQQIQQSQPVQYYPQQQSHQPQQGQNSYQHQFVPQKHQPQQHAPQQQGSPPQHGSPAHNSPQQPVVPQQYGTSQTGAYRQTYQPQHSTTHGQNPAQSGPQPCFNCGNSGHFAMDCPEPIREVPAGKINPQAFQNPLRRPKTGGTVATQHQSRPHPDHAQALPIGHPPPPHGQTGYPQHPQNQQAYSPATPLSAHSPAQAQYYQQWQQYYQSQQAYQQGSHHQGSPYNQQQYTTPHGQATAYSNGSQTPSQASVQGLPHTSGFQMYQSQFVPTSATPVQFNQQSLNNRATAQPDQRAQSSASVKSQSTPPNPHQIQVLDHDLEEDDLDCLDVPDLPKTSLDFPSASQEPINLIGQPLPGNFVVADVLAPFPPPAPQDDGCCKSKYHHDASLDACHENFKDSKYWDKEHADDVAFSDLPAYGKVIPVDEILLMIRQRRAHPEPSDNTNRDSRSQSRTVSMNQDSLEVKNTLDRMERELAETKAKLQAKLDKGRAANAVHASPLQPVKAEQHPFRDHDIKEEYQTPPQSATLEEPIKFEQDAEDVLAALGVTGAPKPVTMTAWPARYTGNGSPNDMHMSRRSRSSSRADTLGVDQHRVQSKSGQVASEHQANGLNSYNQDFAPPPPPQTLSRQQSFPNGTHGSSHSAGLASVDPFGYNTNGVNQSNGNGNVNGAFTPPMDGQSLSPIELRSETSLSRKRHRDSSSDEEDTPKRRQQDDYTPKIKKRQPKVAEAYNRRW